MSGSSVVSGVCVDGNLLTDIPAAKSPVRSRNLRRVINEKPHSSNINQEGKGTKPFALVKQTAMQSFIS